MTLLTYNEFKLQENLNEEGLEYDEKAGGYWITTESGKKILIDKNGAAKTTLGGSLKKGTKFNKVKGL